MKSGRGRTLKTLSNEQVSSPPQPSLDLVSEKESESVSKTFGIEKNEMDLAALRTPMQRIMRRSGNHLLMHQCCQQKERDNFGREIDWRIRILKKSDPARRTGGPLPCTDCFEGRMDGWIRILKK